MTMQNKITGKKIAYKPLNESDLTASERAKAYDRQQRTARIADSKRSQLHAASREMVESAPKDARWFCLQVKSGCEFAVEKVLIDANVEALSPRQKVVMIRRKKKFDCERPYFTGYVLVRFVPSAEAFEALRDQHDVIKFVAGLTGYLVVDDREMKRFQKLKASDVARMPTDKTIVEGVAAQISHGPFSGLECVVLAVKWKREGRARVRLVYDGKAFEISDMPLAFLQKL